MIFRKSLLGALIPLIDVAPRTHTKNGKPGHKRLFQNVQSGFAKPS